MLACVGATGEDSQGSLADSQDDGRGVGVRWDDLRVFLEVARAGTLGGAADALEVNASTVHRRLAAMEEELRARLFDKSPRGYQLTAVGEALLPKAEEAEEAVLAAGRTVVGHDREARGEVRLTLTQDLLPIVVPHLVDFREHCPGVSVWLSADDAVFDLGRAADVALRPGSAPPEQAVGRRIASVAWCRYAPVGAQGEDLPWVSYVGLDRVPAVQWQRRTQQGAEVGLRVDRVAAMQALLGCTRGQGLLPCYVGDPDPRLRRVGELIEEGGTSLWLLVHADLRRAARVRALVDFLVPRLVADRAVFEGGEQELPGGDQSR